MWAKGAGGGTSWGKPKAEEQRARGRVAQLDLDGAVGAPPPPPGGRARAAGGPPPPPLGAPKKAPVPGQK
jgi:hypothetical protein